jgi:hypothetical protein
VEDGCVGIDDHDDAYELVLVDAADRALECQRLFPQMQLGMEDELEPVVERGPELQDHRAGRKAAGRDGHAWMPSAPSSCHELSSTR